MGPGEADPGTPIGTTSKRLKGSSRPLDALSEDGRTGALLTAWMSSSASSMSDGGTVSQVGSTTAYRQAEEFEANFYSSG